MMRLFTIVGILLVAVHNSACFWYLTAKFNDFNEETWIMKNGFMDLSG
jgi:hypothetical protein